MRAAGPPPGSNSSANGMGGGCPISRSVDSGNQMSNSASSTGPRGSMTAASSTMGGGTAKNSAVSASTMRSPSMPGGFSGPGRYHLVHLTCATVSGNATLAAAGFADSVIRVHSLTRDALRAVVPAPANVASDTLDQVDGLREPVGDTCKRLVGHVGGVYAVRISLDTIANAAVYRGHAYPVWDVDIGAEGYYFATASHDRTARLWSPEYIYPLRVFAGHLADVDVMRFHPNSSYVATGLADKTVRLWDVQSGNHVRVLTGHAGAVQALAFSPDGKSLAVAGEDKHVHVWDLGEGKRVKKMASPAGARAKSVVTSLVWKNGNLFLIFIALLLICQVAYVLISRLNTRKEQISH